MPFLPVRLDDFFSAPLLISPLPSSITVAPVSGFPFLALFYLDPLLIVGSFVFLQSAFAIRADRRPVSDVPKRVSTKSMLEKED